MARPFVNMTCNGTFAKNVMGHPSANTRRFVMTARNVVDHRFASMGENVVNAKNVGGSHICNHNKRRSECADCNGSRICRYHNISMCGHLGNPKYDMYCTHCFKNVFTNDARVARIRSKSKEIQWVNALLESPDLPKMEWIWDKPFYVDFRGGCCETKRRIDLRCLLGNTMFCVEIDENQHKYYATDYEIMRYNDLFMDFSGRFVFLRVNPDAYRLNGRMVNPHFDTRLQQVMSKIRDLIHKIQDNACYADDVALIDVHHMFYDEGTEQV